MDTSLALFLHQLLILAQSLAFSSISKKINQLDRIKELEDEYVFRLDLEIFVRDFSTFTFVNSAHKLLMIISKSHL
jgi:hypothetical protein